VFCDITGGDSFSDIYGRGRLFRGFLVKRLCQLTGKPYVLLPQTYGPFKSRTARMLARSVLARAAAVYSRDRESLQELRQLMEKRKMRAVPQLCPDVAFILEPRKPAFDGDLHRIKNSKLRIQNCRLIGLNISGLLYNGGYTQNNQFGLACDYKRLVKEITTYFARQQDCCVLLVPHVIPVNMPVENDLEACKAVWQSLPKELQEKVIVIEGQYDQNEIKYIIGQCDFFLGSRMHATIAALSQCIPAVGMAYSKKFAGVFESVGVADSVVDMRNRNESEILKRIQKLYQNRTEALNILRNTIPAAQQKVLSIFQPLTE
jgi:polysaccharide pyruvyl transferase WcaK-like protein